MFFGKRAIFGIKKPKNSCPHVDFIKQCGYNEKGIEIFLFFQKNCGKN